jgi:hypothetical protein
MKLAGYIPNGGAVADVRDVRELTAEEMKQHLLYKPVVAEARNRLALFRVHDENFRKWENYLLSLLHPGPVDENAVVLELDRLLLNYLDGAYHLRAHFEASFHQRFRTDSSEQKKYKMLLDGLCQAAWPYAFFLDFQHYLKQQGLGLGFFKREVGPTSVTLTLTLNAAELLNTTKDWPRSKLVPAKGIMELTGLLREFHAQVMQKYSAIVLQTFFADLAPASEFYKKLAGEVRAQNAGLTMALRENGTSPAQEPRLVLAPNDLFAELGLASLVR